MKIVIHLDPPGRVPDPALPLRREPAYACPNCGAQLRPSGGCPACPTWARPPGLRPYPPR